MEGTIFRNLFDLLLCMHKVCTTQPGVAMTCENRPNCMVLGTMRSPEMIVRLTGL